MESAKGKAGANVPHHRGSTNLQDLEESLGFQCNVMFAAKTEPKATNSEHRPQQCKYRFKSWGWKKSISDEIKQAVCIKALNRAAQGKESFALYRGQDIPMGRLQRTLETTTQQQASMSMMFSLPTDRYEIIGRYVPFGNSLYVLTAGKQAQTDAPKSSELEDALWFEIDRPYLCLDPWLSCNNC